MITLSACCRAFDHAEDVGLTDDVFELVVDDDFAAFLPFSIYIAMRYVVLTADVVALAVVEAVLLAEGVVVLIEEVVVRGELVALLAFVHTLLVEVAKACRENLALEFQMVLLKTYHGPLSLCCTCDWVERSTKSFCDGKTVQERDKLRVDSRSTGIVTFLNRLRNDTSEG